MNEMYARTTDTETGRRLWEKKTNADAKGTSCFEARTAEALKRCGHRLHREFLLKW